MGDSQRVSRRFPALTVRGVKPLKMITSCAPALALPQELIQVTACIGLPLGCQESAELSSFLKHFDEFKYIGTQS